MNYYRPLSAALVALIVVVALQGYALAALNISAGVPVSVASLSSALTITSGTTQVGTIVTSCTVTNLGQNLTCPVINLFKTQTVTLTVALKNSASIVVPFTATPTSSNSTVATITPASGNPTSVPANTQVTLKYTITALAQGTTTITALFSA